MRSRNDWLIRHPERISDSLANVILHEGSREVILGQGWLAAPGKMVTCGHVVERFAGNPTGLFVKFPSSGNVYPVQSVRLHPSFVRQPDQLVKFDLALLEVNLSTPESMAAPLPFTYEQALQTNQTLWVIRYPTHLAQLSAATQPLTQDGKFLGPLRKHDSFHLLHDLPLAPGDSGAPITDGSTILAVHCGDTATLPGLNLPTTSIRLALWVDALKDLGLTETVRPGVKHGNPLVFLILAFVISALAASAGAYQFMSKEVSQKWAVLQPKVAPVRISFNEPIHGYSDKQPIQITLVPGSPSYVYLFAVDQSDRVMLLFPQAQFGQEPRLDKGEVRLINRFGNAGLFANKDRDRLHVVALDASSPEGQRLSAKIFTKADMPDPTQDESFGLPLKINARDLLARIRSLKEESPELIIHSDFDSPHSK